MNPTSAQLQLIPTEQKESLDSYVAIKTSEIEPFKSQLLKWIGNKQRFAHGIAAYFPTNYGTYFEPFLGSGAVLGTLAPQKAVASDVFLPLIEIWKKLHDDPQGLIDAYTERWALIEQLGKVDAYEKVKAQFNAAPNGMDLLFLCRACYGGVVRFRKRDGYMSTPCGVHPTMSPKKFAARVYEWAKRTAGTQFLHSDYAEVMAMAKPGDVIYCDPPYSDSQAILYGAQSFKLEELFDAIQSCKENGVYVVLSIDGTKKSGNKLCELEIPDGLFQREVFVDCGRSMLKRFQMEGQTLEAEEVTDRLLLTY